MNDALFHYFLYESFDIDFSTYFSTFHWFLIPLFRDILLFF